MPRLSDELLTLPLYREDPTFRQIVDTYRDPEKAFSYTSQQHVFNMGVMLGFVTALSEEVARAEECLAELEIALKAGQDQ